MTELTLETWEESLISSAAPSAEQVQVQLERILGSKDFARSPRLQRFLRYAVESSLRGDERGVKEYTLGVEVFDREECFDPRLDSIVRVEAFRARKKLARYYLGDGRTDEVLIFLSKGDYRARCVFAQPGYEAAPDRPRALRRGSMRFWESRGPGQEAHWVDRRPGDEDAGFFETIHAADRDMLRRAISDSFETGLDLNLNIRTQISPDAVLHARAHGTVLTDEEGRAHRLLGICIGLG